MNSKHSRKFLGGRNFTDVQVTKEQSNNATFFMPQIAANHAAALHITDRGRICIGNDLEQGFACVRGEKRQLFLQKGD